MNESPNNTLNAPKPTDAEVEILSVLWQRGPSAVREVHDEINAHKRPVGYTTVLKQMQMMHEKGLVRRDESQRAHVYAAAFGQEQTQRREGRVDERVERPAPQRSAGEDVDVVLPAKRFRPKP